jgi:flavin-binding protein dodecin
LFGAGVEAIGSAPETLAAAITDEIARMQKIIRSAGIRDE